MITKSDLEKMFGSLPDAIRRSYLDRVSAFIETEKEDRNVILYVLRILFHDFIKPIDMINALSMFLSSTEELGIKGIALSSPEAPLASEEELKSFAMIRMHFSKILYELEIKDEFRDFLEINFDFLKGEG